MATKTFTPAQAGVILGTSSYKVRRLCEAGLIDADLTGTGRWKIPSSEVTRCQRDGIPEIPPPETADPDRNTEDHEESQNSAAPKPGQHGPPSKKVIKSQERVVKLENKVREKGLRKEIRELDRAQQEEEQERAQSRRAARWRQESLDYALARSRMARCTPRCTRKSKPCWIASDRNIRRRAL